MSSYPLIRTKVRTPRLRGSLLRRPRLVNFVHGNIQHKLILISAGAGYGKTSLLIDYAHDTELPICWYSLDHNDARVRSFVEYLVASVRERFPSFGDSLFDYLQENQGPQEDVEPLVRLLVNEIEENTNRYFAIILDDYHEVVDSEPVNALLDGVLRYLPEHCHIILASRAIPRRLTLTRLAARQEVVGLGVEELRFTPDEIRGVLENLGYTDLTPEQVEILANRTEGWITGVLLAAQANRSGATKDILELTGASAGVFDYMAEEILQRQPEEVQRFLMGSALFTEMSPSLCDALLDIKNSAQILRDLFDQNLFTIALDAEGFWYQYHQIFREFLVAKLERDDPETYRALCLKQARIMAHRGDWPRAIEGFLLADAHGQAAEALEVIVHEMFVSGEWDTLKGWLDQIPPRVLADHPTLLLFRAKICTETGDLARSATLLNEAYRAFGDRRDDVGAARALVQMAVVQRFRGRPQEALETSRRALDLAGDRDPLTQVQATREIGICQFMLGRVTDSIRELVDALERAEAYADDTSAAFIALDLGTVELSRGNLLGARRQFHQALLYWRRIGNESGLANTLLNLGVVHHHLGQYAEAESRFQEGLNKARLISDTRIEAYSLASLGDLYRDIQRYDQALECYQAARRVAGAAQFARLLIYCLNAEGDTRRLIGDLSAAHQDIVEALDQAREGEMVFEEGLCHLSMGALELTRRAPDAARESLRRALDLLEQVDSRRDVARTHLYLAAAAQALGDHDALSAELDAVARLARELGTNQFVVAEAPGLPDLLRHAEREGPAGLNLARIREEVERLAPAPTASSVIRVREARRSLEFLALRGGRVLRHGRFVSDWESASARLLAFLFVAHPEGMRRDAVIEALWPEVNREKGNSLFHSTLYRLRTALIRDLIEHRGGLYRVNPAHTYYYDVDEFVRLARQGQGDDDVGHAARVQAISLYQTPFLEGLDCAWCDQQRLSLHKDMVNLLVKEGQFLARRGALAEAEGQFSRACALEPYEERAYRGMMWCRAQNGDQAGAIRLYLECAQVLRDELGTDPSPETLSLYESIQEGIAPKALG